MWKLEITSEDIWRIFFLWKKKTDTYLVKKNWGKNDKKLNLLRRAKSIEHDCNIIFLKINIITM